jgi:hypothetical protein
MVMWVQSMREATHSSFLGPRAHWEDEGLDLALDHVITQARTALAARLLQRHQAILVDKLEVDVLLREVQLQLVEASSRNDLVRAKDLADLAMDIVHCFMNTRQVV